jgi:anti-sigma regulatory factor (Ser/Thr protein kinase)
VNEPDQRSVFLTIGTSHKDLATLYEWLDDAARPDALPAALLNRLHIALEEAVLNVAMHGDLPADDAKIAIEYLSAADSVTLAVTDSGKNFDPTAEPSPDRAATIATAEIGGKGLILLRHYCKDISYRREAGRNQLTMRFPRA